MNKSAARTPSKTMVKATPKAIDTKPASATRTAVQKPTPGPAPAKPVNAKVTAKVTANVSPQAAAVAVKPTKSTKVAKADTKPEKVKKPKLVRDSFTIPKNEYELLDALKARGVALKQPVKKSELIRAGIKLLVSLSDAAFLNAITAVPALKTGRPGKVA